MAFRPLHALVLKAEYSAARDNLAEVPEGFAISIAVLFWILRLQSLLTFSAAFPLFLHIQATISSISLALGLVRPLLGSPPALAVPFVFAGGISMPIQDGQAGLLLKKGVDRHVEYNQ